MDLYMVVLRIVHIFSGVFWVGATWMTAGFLAPAAEAIGSDAEKFLAYINHKRRLPSLIGSSAGLTILAGLLLYWHDSAGLQLSWITSPTGLGFTFGALCAIIQMIFAFALLIPTIKRLDLIGQEIHSSGKPPTADEVSRLHQVQHKLEGYERIAALLLVLALLGMVSARYL
jgi:uncharacterized membrane protein